MPLIDSKSDPYTRALAAASYIRSLHATPPVLGIILGSGLGNFATHVEQPTAIAYADIPGWPLSTVEGHSGKLILGTHRWRQRRGNAGTRPRL
jgi:purine-nucleoside phosphorylase